MQHHRRGKSLLNPRDVYETMSAHIRKRVQLRPRDLLVATQEEQDDELHYLWDVHGVRSGSFHDLLTWNQQRHLGRLFDMSSSPPGNFDEK